MTSSRTILITGINGTLAPVLAMHLQQHPDIKFHLVPWDRQRISPEDHQAVEQFVMNTRPSWICHLGMGPESWAGQLAGLAARLDSGFLFTSTALVFGDEKNGPFETNSPRFPSEETGQYKLRCEDAVLAANPNSLIVRLGWQIGFTRGGNNLVEALEQLMDVEGRIEASEHWIPAVSFLDDSALAMIDLMIAGAQGIYHVDSNAHSAMTFLELVTALKQYLNQDKWHVTASSERIQDQRLLDSRIQVPSVTSRLARH